jgi:hypothetical protein
VQAARVEPAVMQRAVASVQRQVLNLRRSVPESSPTAGARVYAAIFFHIKWSLNVKADLATYSHIQYIMTAMELQVHGRPTSPLSLL